MVVSGKLGYPCSRGYAFGEQSLSYTQQFLYFLGYEPTGRMEILEGAYRPEAAIHKQDPYKGMFRFSTN